ncbi:unnamed protein product [Schistosoma margrebowiei]|uniref:Clathrin light chain n=1 Tax=Schistosoma margrebowiei TaxID=48269 RepID=A0A183NBL1_9TREM|nr:unnamed protein product [Schistosoma margrebowiei]
MVAGDQRLVHTPFVPAGYWSPCAPLELNNWYKEYHQILETKSRELREKKPDSNGHFMNGNGSKPSVKDTAVWESICNLCDFQSKQKTAIDTSRMRNILLSLKPNN